MIIKKQKNNTINPNEQITLTKNNHRIQITYIKNKPKDFPIKKLNNNQYIYDHHNYIFQHKKTRKHNNSNYVSSQKLYTLIMFNFTGSTHNEYSVTLTYKHNMIDPKQLTKDFNQLIRKLKKIYPNLGYIRINELQSRNSFHIHLLLKNTPHLTNLKIQNLWIYGLTHTKQIQNQIEVNKIANYFKYSPNTKNPKKIKKAKLFQQLPSGTNYFSKSKNIKYPMKQKTSYQDGIHYINKNNYKLIDQKTFNIINTNNNQCVNQITKQTYIK